MAADIRRLVTEYVQAIGEKRFDRLAELVRPDAIVDGMVGRTLQGKEEFVGGPRRLAPILLRTAIRRIFVDGDEALVIYDLVTDSPAGAILSTEWLTFEDELIRSSVLIYDGRRWPEAMRELERRAPTAPTAAS